MPKPQGFKGICSCLGTTEIREERKDEMTMYEAPEVVAIGEAHDLILGVKPFQLNVTDSESAINRLEREEDIDESDE